MLGASLVHRGPEILWQGSGVRAHAQRRNVMGIPFLHPIDQPARRPLLPAPGVATWTSIPPRRSWWSMTTLWPSTACRPLAGRISYVSGDLAARRRRYARVARAIGDAKCPVFCREIPPFLFGPVIKGLTEAGLTKNGRVVVEKPFGHDLDSRKPSTRKCTDA
jgi:Glucose-6-phosphate dehydrogenase, NAD binding domain